MPRLRKPKLSLETQLQTSEAAEAKYGHFHTDGSQTLPASFIRFIKVRGLKERLVKPASPATKH